MIKDSGIIIESTIPNFIDIKEKLTYRGFSWDDTPVTFDMYQELEDGKIKIPRFFPITDSVQDNSEIGEEIHLTSTVVPRNDRQKKSVDFLVKNNNGILKLEPGTGKTVIMIDALSKIGRRSIIFVHKDSLRKNWKEEIHLHTDLKNEEVVFLTTTKFKEHFQKSIIISTVQTFISGLKKPEFVKCLQDSKIGVAVFDECHTTVGPEQFSKASLNINVRRVYGLSATPIRFDLTDILSWHLGEVTYFEPGEKELIIPIVYQCRFSFGVIKKFNRYLTWGGKFQYIRYYKQMNKIEGLFDKVSSIIKNCYSSGRKILILGHNVKALIKLAQKCNLPKEDVGIFIPSATDEMKESVSDIVDIDVAFKTKNVVFSTYGACRDGNNKPELDCLVMFTPTSNVRQAAGRVLRYLENKSKPIILDLVDTDKCYGSGSVWSLYETNRTDTSKKVGIFVKSSEYRKAIYEELGWVCKIKNI